MIIKLINGNGKALECFRSIDGVYIPSVTVGELTYGAYKSSKRDYNMKLFHGFISEYPILGVDLEVSYIYGKIKCGLYKSGFQIPENDIWISSIAIKNELTLVTYDKHFKNVGGLDCWLLSDSG